MKVLVAGGEGFIGRNVSALLEEAGHDVYKSAREPKGEKTLGIDLLDAQQVQEKISALRPEVIINCAGVVGADSNYDDNVTISKNLLESAIDSDPELKRFVVCGSAGVYGNVDRENWPVKEDTPLLASNPYPLSKIAEEEVVRGLAQKHGVDAVVARIFNPIGANMPQKFLVTNVLEQVDKIKSGATAEVTVGRADALRDYVDVKDVSHALALLATREHIYPTYNIGSGVATSTEELVGHIISASMLDRDVTIVEASSQPEQPVASQADISRMRDEFNWTPTVPLKQTIKGVVDERRK